MATMTQADDNPNNSSLAKYYSSKIVELREVSTFYTYILLNGLMFCWFCWSAVDVTVALPFFPCAHRSLVFRFNQYNKQQSIINQ